MRWCRSLRDDRNQAKAAPVFENSVMQQIIHISKDTSTSTNYPS